MGQAMPPRSILIVEDEPFIRYDLVDFFEDRGFRVFEAEDADEAIGLLDANHAIRIVLTDVQMPGSMDGVKLAHHVRDRYPPTILIVVSGMVNPTSAELPARALFVSKPFDPRYVLREIERLSS
ncbi:response regulator [Sphingomonas melonis]|uniref:Response regulator n=3 Tax=Sphingomonadaceae TaxID=41297 RepID=A0ABX2JUF4_9SPHN|nr:response regulator [Sphingomonas hominis]MBX8846733.1 response regulator [Sphingomonas melonis]MBX8855701.1 response regulator [Sphingomonas melonis]MBX8900706.1 response regulator [Sphingomonas melonis]NTS66657.1 response regulator [Sphingomonas hominis]